MGIWPSPAVAAVVAALPRPDEPSVRWTTAEQWHVTLRFLGEVAEDEAPAVVDALRAVVGAQPPARAVVGPLTTRLGQHALVAPVAGLDDLAQAVGDATRDLGEPLEPREFKGHLTLARGRGRRTVPLSLPGQAVAASWDVEEVALVRSLFDTNGARYETLKALRLGAGPSPA